MAQAGLPDLLSNPALRSMAEGLMGTGAVKVVTNYICDNCDGQISGDRYNSTTNKDFDLCSACFRSPVGEKLNVEHQFKRVSALESLIHCLSNGGSFDASFAPGAATEDVPARHHAICDQCDQGIVGVRHKCLDCPDFDLCNVCNSGKAVHEEGHVFYAMHDPNVRAVPKDVMEAHLQQKAQQAAAEEEARKSREAEEAAKKAVEEARKAAEEAAKRSAEATEAARVAMLTRVKRVPAAPQPVAPPLEEREPSAFEKNLQTLESMGFTDRKRNIQILVRNRGKLFESIQELLQ
jgi:hypothetical protein